MLFADTIPSVSQLAESVKALVDDRFGPVWVRGELVGCKVWSSGHWYFTLRDAGAQMRCCMWRTWAARAGKPPADGTEVFALATPEFYPPKGDFQLVVTRLLPTATVGDQQRAVERTKAALQRDGLFDPARKRALPAYPMAIAVVTSLDGAALHDIVTVTRKRWPCATLFVIRSRVQGEGAVADLVAALRLVNRLPDVELCIVGRGGGAREDLSAFDQEAVCRALAEVRVPTVSAVGHETDVSLTDLVADVRAATPSAAAEMACADRREVLRLTADLGARLAGALHRRIRLTQERFERAGDRLQAAMAEALARRREAGERLGAQLEALSPLRVLQRGYAVPRGADGRVLRRRADFTPGRPFSLRVADGEVAARAE